jgi:pimeloyl-ACP methyl ester carboxylesterase
MTDFQLSETRYAQSGDVNIAYQVMGGGPIDLIMVPGLFSHIEFMHEMPGYTAFLRRLSGFSRVVIFDKRGQGLSDRISGAARSS